MSHFEPGQVILVVFPFTDAMAGKLRPALVVSGRRFNAGEDFVAVPISSRLADDDPFSFPIRESDSFFAETGLKCDSAVKWTKPQTISSRVVERRLGEVPPDVLRNIRRLIETVFS